MIAAVVSVTLLFVWHTPRVNAESYSPQTQVADSRELQNQDMLVLFLLPLMEQKLAEVYVSTLKESPGLYPYYVDVTKVERVNGFRGYEFRITLHATPTLGPHIPVGEDLFTFEISPGPKVKLIKFEHVKGPEKKKFPPNYQDLLR
ncbi:hypothetical protein A8709_17840 [Paenibacillus pectinilyticus]|uniref:DUF3888 domain-containing protein n=1 Tax=Paenibacillus pectinilyticus TaxID=512399 RepID=A0A1C1A0J9_9BACL|nr:hypothetical protein A8709_17840 [Paenibacillus pectinilyticus]